MEKFIEFAGMVFIVALHILTIVFCGAFVGGIVEKESGKIMVKITAVAIVLLSVTIAYHIVY